MEEKRGTEVFISQVEVQGTKLHSQMKCRYKQFFETNLIEY